MKDPVKTIDGHIYDRDAILQWFRFNTTSPLTGLNLQSTILEPDIELKNQARRLANLAPIKIRIRTCIAYEQPFESAGNRTCGCNTRSTGYIAGREII